MSCSVQVLRPPVLATAAFLLIVASGLDRAIAHALFFDSGRWLGAGSGAWWARDLLHGEGRWLVRGVAAGSLLVWVTSFVASRWRARRGSAGLLFAAMVLPVAVVGALKMATDVDCPWDLAEFGGTRPYLALFAHRPDYLPAARCFPGAHSASGFALMCFYFLWRERRPHRARWALWAGLGVGSLFAFGQEARGAHFLSHDLASAILVWTIQSALYRRFGAVRPALQQDARQRIGNHAGGQTAEDVS